MYLGLGESLLNMKFVVKSCFIPVNPCLNTASLLYTRLKIIVVNVSNCSGDWWQKYRRKKSLSVI